MNPWKTGNPEKKGRYFCLADFKEPVVMGKLSKVCRQNVPIVSIYTPEEGWSNALDEIVITHWMDVPDLKEDKFKFVQVDLSKPPKRPPALFKVDKQGINIQWSGYDYFIEWNRLKTKEDILRWICHLGEKEWKNTTPERIVRFINAVYAKWEWNMYPTSNDNSDEAPSSSS